MFQNLNGPAFMTGAIKGLNRKPSMSSGPEESRDQPMENAIRGWSLLRIQVAPCACARLVPGPRCGNPRTNFLLRRR